MKMIMASTGNGALTPALTSLFVWSVTKESGQPYVKEKFLKATVKC